MDDKFTKSLQQRIIKQIKQMKFTEVKRYNNPMFAFYKVFIKSVLR